MARCTTRDFDYQPFPKAGPLAKTMNLRLDALRDCLSPDATVYLYIIATIESREGLFVQTGSGPNFQGSLVTLCTCKHFMRTFRDAGGWKGKWVAGFTGVGAGHGKNRLVYLMRVSQAYESHRDFWSSESIPLKTKKAKAAHLHKYGDIFEPLAEIGDPFLSTLTPSLRPIPTEIPLGPKLGFGILRKGTCWSFTVACRDGASNRRPRCISWVILRFWLQERQPLSHRMMRTAFSATIST